MNRHISPDFYVKLAQTESDLRAAQRLRYEVFVSELGAAGPLVDHAERLEQDDFDPYVDHLLLCDRHQDKVVGVYRLMQPEMAARAGRYSSATEYDLSVLEQSGKRLLELGRSCLHVDYRGGTAMHHLWSALARYVVEHQIDVLFGVASFHGTDIARLAAPLSLLHHRHLAPAALRPVSLKNPFRNSALLDEVHLDRKACMAQVPSLIKAYLRLGGYIGEGVFVDHDFNTTDVCLVIDTKQLSQKQARIYLRPQA